MSDLLHLSISDTILAISACTKGGVVPIVYGPPGIGKTDILQLVAQECGLELQVLTGGTLSDRDDIAGTPWVRNSELSWAHRAQIRAAIERPCLLVLDEFSTIPESAQSSALALLLGNRAGDTPLHPQSRVMALANDPQHAPGAVRLMPATANRLGFFNMTPKIQETAEWFQKRPELALSEFGLLLPHKTDFVQYEPPSAKVEAGKTWGSPRAWANGLRAFGQCGVGFSDDAKSHRVGYATLSAFVGADLAGGYLTLRAQRKRLPAFEDILRDPKAAARSLDKKSADVMLAALGAVPAIATQDSGAAWVWVSELPQRYIGAAATALCGGMPWTDGPWSKEGRKVSMKALADLGASGTGLG